MEDKNAIYQMRFPQKLWYLLSLRPDAILWGGTGRTILLNYRVLQNYLQCDHSVFKTTNISSFVRQLNLYGFRKVTSHLQDPLCNSSNPFMHEYVHDYFQLGRPELLNKITRKALTMKRNVKLKNTYNHAELINLTPLQKARYALRMALKKAAQELSSQDTPRHIYSALDYDDSQEDICEEDESFELEWLHPNSENIQIQINLPPEPAVSVSEDPKKEVEINKTYVFEMGPDKKSENKESVRDTNRDCLMSFSNESCPDNSDALLDAASFLSMPDLDAVPTDTQTGTEARNMDEHGSVNRMLPSVSHDQNDSTTINENSANMDHYNGEWDQMFNEMINQSANQECGSELKDLYSQISKTIDLLND